MIGLADIVGQQRAVEQLGRALRTGRLPHALLLTGPEGVGRETTATALSRALLCQHPVNADDTGGGDLPDGCGNCEDCRLVAAGTHPDLHRVYKELARYHDDPAVRDRVMQDLSIAVVRQFLIAPAGRGATRAHGKVFLVRDAELMSIPAQNALLKTLEEPPEGVRILLICRSAEQLLPTTRSRCWPVRFGPLPREFVVARLRDRGVDEAEASFWAAFTDGSLGRSIDLSARGIYRIKCELIERLAATGPHGDVGFGEFLRDTADALAEQAVRDTRSEQQADLSKQLATRQAGGILLRLLAGAFRDAVRSDCGASGPADLVHTDQPREIEAVRVRMPVERLLDVLEHLGEYERLLWRNVNPRTVWDNVAISCASGAPLWV